MKYIVLLLFLCSFQQEEPLFVLKTKGTVINLETNKALKTGDKIYTHTRLKYEVADDYVEVIGNKRGRGRVYWNTTHGPRKKNSWVGAVKDYFVPAVRPTSLATRNATYNSPEEIGAYIRELTREGDHPLLIVQSLDIPVHPTFYTNRDAYFFYIRYREGVDTINAKLSFKAGGDSLQASWLRFDEKCCLLQRAGMLPLAAKIYYYDVRAERSYLVVDDLSFVFAGINELLPEIQVLVGQLDQAGSNKQNVEDEVTAYLLANYGAAPKAAIMKLIQATR